MKRYIHKMSRQITQLSIWASAMMLMAGALTSCIEHPEETEVTGAGDAYINLSFNTAQATTSRGASTEEGLKDNETPAHPSEESEIHSIRVWAFETNSGDNGKPIAYQNVPNIQSKDGKYTLNIRFLRKTQNKEINNIDLYILANAETILNTSTLSIYDSSVITRKNLKDALLSKPFGIENNKPETTEVPSTGLPISRAITNISVNEHCADTENGAATKSIKIPLIRAISKLHFFFARKEDGNTNGVKVNKIVVDGNVIPQSSYIFPDEEKYNDALSNQNATRSYEGSNIGYDANTIQLDGVANSNITAVANPKDFCRGNETASNYMERLTNAKIESQDLCYLRETNKAVTGTIYYQLSGSSEEKQASFSIPTNGNAIRNRELVVYGYFQNGEMGKLTLEPLVKEWEDGGTYTYIDATTGVEIGDGDQTDWGYKVYYGDPKRGPMIVLKDIDTGGKPWILQTDNPMFGFVRCREDGTYPEKEGDPDIDGITASPVYDTNITSNNDGRNPIGYTYHIEDYILNTDGQKKTLRFYVVPKNRLDLAKPHNIKAQVFLTKNPSDKFILNPKLFYKGCKDGEFAGKDIHFEQVL